MSEKTPRWYYSLVGEDGTIYGMGDWGYEVALASHVGPEEGPVMAAAPALLEALEGAPVIHIDEPTNSVMPGFVDKYQNWLARARAAIAEARPDAS